MEEDLWKEIPFNSIELLGLKGMLFSWSKIRLDCNEFQFLSL